MNGNTPYVLRGGQEDPSRLFFSKQELAFTKSITIPAGFGLIKSGAIMAKITESTNRLGQYVPYTPEAPALALEYAWGAAYLVQDAAAGTDIYVTKEDSYKFAVGDHLAIADSDDYNASAEDCGAITAIDRTTYAHMAKITVTNSITGSTFTAANGAWVWIQSATAAPYVAAVGVLFAPVDTGLGEDAQGGNGVLIVKNAMLYKDLLYNYDSEVLTDLGGSEDGQYLVI